MRIILGTKMKQIIKEAVNYEDDAIIVLKQLKLFIKTY